MVSCQVLAIDLRGHGESKTHNEENLSAETQADDIVTVIKQMFGSDPPPIVLIGHRYVSLLLLNLFCLLLHLFIFLH